MEGDVQGLNASVPKFAGPRRHAHLAGVDRGAVRRNRMCPYIASGVQCTAPSPTSEKGPQIAG